MKSSDVIRTHVTLSTDFINESYDESSDGHAHLTHVRVIRGTLGIAAVTLSNTTHTDRQTDRQTDISSTQCHSCQYNTQTDRQTDRQTSINQNGNKHINTQINDKKFLQKKNHRNDC